MDQVSPKHSALAHFKVRPSYATDAVTATALVTEIIADAGEGLIAVDLETTPCRANGRGLRISCAE